MGEGSGVAVIDRVGVSEAFGGVFGIDVALCGAEVSVGSGVLVGRKSGVAPQPHHGQDVGSGVTGSGLQLVNNKSIRITTNIHWKIKKFFWDMGPPTMPQGNEGIKNSDILLYCLEGKIKLYRENFAISASVRRRRQWSI